MCNPPGTRETDRTNAHKKRVVPVTLPAWNSSHTSGCGVSASCSLYSPIWLNQSASLRCGPGFRIVLAVTRLKAFKLWRRSYDYCLFVTVCVCPWVWVCLSVWVRVWLYISMDPLCLLVNHLSSQISYLWKWMRWGCNLFIVRFSVVEKFDVLVSIIFQAIIQYFLSY